MFCQKCGKQLRDDAAFCDGCGERQNVSPQQVTPVYQQQTPFMPAYFQNPTALTFKKNISILPIILLSIGATGTLLLFFISLFSYDYIYFFDGYDSTSVFWILSGMFILSGLILFLVNLKKQIKMPHFKLKAIFVSILTLLLPIAIVSGVFINQPSSYYSSNTVTAAGQAAQAAQDRLDRLYELKAQYDEIQTRLNSLPKGSSAYKAAVAENNRLVKEIVKEFPEMAPYVSTR